MNQIPNIGEWEEPLMHIMESYIMTAELGHLAKDQVKHKQELRAYYAELVEFIHQQLQKAREESGKRNAVVKEYKDEGVMFVLKVEDGKTYEANMPIPKWAEVGKLKLRVHSELEQPTASM